MSNLSFDDLKGQVCVITGGAGVIGYGLAKGLAQAGVKVAILDINEEKVVEVASELKQLTGGIVVGYKANVLDEESLQNAKKRINEDLGIVTLLINGAGGNSNQKLAF
ncbi:MAG: SDR family NAD(P)-dependent oxidoreductase [Bacteroidales bacterium]|nr:SDR family NAD(P)-dependent oxidoreductase [Bacteroidales bacterium]